MMTGSRLHALRWRAKPLRWRTSSRCALCCAAHAAKGRCALCAAQGAGQALPNCVCSFSKSPCSNTCLFDFTSQLFMY